LNPKFLGEQTLRRVSLKIARRRNRGRAPSKVGENPSAWVDSCASPSPLQRKEEGDAREGEGSGDGPGWFVLVALEALAFALQIDPVSAFIQG
jgi:hypothetical protein